MRIDRCLTSSKQSQTHTTNIQNLLSVNRRRGPVQTARRISRRAVQAELWFPLKVSPKIPLARKLCKQSPGLPQIPFRAVRPPRRRFTPKGCFPICPNMHSTYLPTLARR